VPVPGAQTSKRYASVAHEVHREESATCSRLSQGSRNHTAYVAPHRAGIPTLSGGATLRAATGKATELTRAPPALLREGPDFRFEFVSQCNLPTDKGLFTLRAYRYTDHKTGKQVRTPP
jgi:hypothetical protein